MNIDPYIRLSILGNMLYIENSNYLLGIFLLV